jgi:hypothetical protein
MRWQDFAEARPELAQLGEERFRRAEVMLLGTLRKNGRPRISPVEMWRSPKALDLCNRLGSEGDFKLYGRDPQRGLRTLD